VYGSDPNLELPYTLQINAGLDRSLGAAQTMSATYIQTAGRRLYRTEFYQAQLTNFSQLRIVRNLDESDYHALQLQYRRRMSSGLQVLAQYTLSKSTDTSSSEAQMYLPVLLSSPEANRGPSDFDRRHSYSVAATYLIPTPSKPGLVRAVFRDFSLDVIHKAFSASPVDVVSPGASPNLNLLNFRPDVVPGVPLVIEDAAAPGGRRFNRAAFVARTDTNGSLGRNTLRGFPFSQLDLALRRRFNFGATAIEMRVESFNLLNQANFANPVGTLTASTFGTSTQMLNSMGGLNSLYQIGGPRAVQLALRVRF
jgi:hypothetical protein